MTLTQHRHRERPCRRPRAVRRRPPAQLRWPRGARGGACPSCAGSPPAGASPTSGSRQVGEHYHLFGGRSPINDQNRALIAALRAELDARGIDTPIVWGNRNSAPFLDDALREAHAAGHRRVVVADDERLLVLLLLPAVPREPRRRRCRRGRGGHRAGDRQGRPSTPRARASPTPTSASSSESLRALDGAPDARDRAALRHPLDPRRPWTTRPGPATARATSTSASTSRSRRQLTDEANRVLGRDLTGELVFCSRSGPPTQPWLEPDVNDRMRSSPPRASRTVVAGARSASSATTWRSSTTSTPRRGRRPTSSASTLVRVPTVGTDAVLRARPRRRARSSAPPRRAARRVAALRGPHAVGVRARAAAPTCARPGRPSAAATEAG